MATLSELVVRISASTEGLTRGMENVKRSLGGVERQAATLNNTIGGLLTFGAIVSVMNRASEAASAQESAQRRLSATSKLLGADLSGLQAQAVATGEKFHLSARVAQDFTGAMARLTTAAGQNNRLGEATAAWLNLAAANGIGAEESMDALRLTILGQDEGLNKLGLANPSGIYKQWADAAGIAAGKMTDAQKSQAILDAVIAAGSRTRDAYAEWLRSSAGQQSILRAKVEDSSAALGQAVNGIKVLALPALAGLVEGFAHAIGGIELFGADLFVAQARVRVWAAQVSASVGDMVQGVASHFGGLASFLDGLPAPIKAMMGLSGNLRLGPGGSALGASLSRDLAAAQAALAAARAARDEVSASIVQQVSGFASGGGGGESPFTPPATATGAVKHLSDAVDQLGQKWADAAKRAGDAWKNALDINQAAVQRVASAMVTAAPSLPGLRKEIPNIDSKVAQRIENQKGAGIQGVVSDFRQGVGQILAQFGPVGLAFQALGRVIAPLQPLVEALFQPFAVVGEVLSALLIPVLRLAFIPLKYFGIAIAFLGEIIAKVAGAIANAIGQLVRGIGRLVNKLPGSPGDPLVKAGQAMIDLGKQFRDAAKEMAAKRKELEAMTFDDALNGAADAANKLSEALINAAQGFKIDRFRFGATSTGSAAVAAGGGAAASVSYAGAVFNLPAVGAGGRSAAENYREWIAELKRDALSNPGLRPFAAQFT